MLDDHVRELRTRLAKAIISLAAGMFISFIKVDDIISIINKPIKKFLVNNGTLVVTKVTDSFFLVMKSAFFGGLIISLPFILYQLWSYISVTFPEREKRYSWLMVLLSWILFMAGIYISYNYVLVSALHFLLSIKHDIARPMIGVCSYFDFSIFLLISGGLLFQLPVAINILMKLGLLKREYVEKKRGVLYILLALLVAVLTPSQDPFSMLVLLVPVLAFFELSLLIIRLGGKKLK